MAEVLTPAQQRAVTHRGSKLLVSAAAGSGKTKVLVERLMGYLTENPPANLDDFLMITYTKAAASELRGKIAKRLAAAIAADSGNRHLQQQLQRLYLAQISTVHGFCGDVLRQYAYRLDLPADFRVADENECTEIRAQVVQDLMEQAYAEDGNDDFRSLVDTQGYGRDDSALPKLILKVYDSARCHRHPDAWLSQCLSDAAAEGITDAGDTLWGKQILQELHRQVDEHMAALSWCIDRLSGMDKMEKVLSNLGDTLSQLQILRGLNSWDDVHAFGQLNYSTLSFPRKMEDTFLQEQVKALRNRCKEEMSKALTVFSDDSKTVMEDLAQCAASQQTLISLVRRFDENYRRKKRAARILDFSDLEHQMLRLLYGSSETALTPAAREIALRFREIMVDEYQDSNEVQDAIFDALTRQKQNLFMVGDVKQSIYQFRLADPDIFLEKYKAYSDIPHADSPGTRVMLSANFRSGGEVVEAVNDVFTRCMSEQVGGIAYTQAEALIEGVPHKPLPDSAVELHCIASGADAYGAEAAFVAGRIAEMLRSQTLIRDGDSFRAVRPEDIVILLRSPNSVGGVYRRTLEAAGIPCNAGGGENLFRTPEVTTLRSLLQVISNPRQDIPLISALASPVFGFTADDLTAIRSCGKGLLYDAMTASELPKAKAFLDVLQELRLFSRRGTLTELISRVLNSTRLDSIYAAQPEGSAKAKNLQTFFTLACDYEAGSVRTLEQFLEHVAALEEKGIASETAPSGVTIMSIHKSKGLEFPVVFLCALSRSFNMKDKSGIILCDKNLGLGMSVVDTGNRIRYPSIARRAIAARMGRDAVSEEMRILYVAMTRARDRLIMTYTEKNLAAQLQKLCLSISYDGGAGQCAKATCPGTWVLLTALARTEAGVLRQAAQSALGGQVHEVPWLVTLRTADETAKALPIADHVETAVLSPALDAVSRALAFSYPYEAATRAPSKQTATGRKDHFRDAEAAEHTKPALMLSHRVPSFVSQSKDGRAYGTAMHLCMQHINFAACTDVQGVEDEVHRLTSEGFLKEEQAKMVNVSQIFAFFASPLGRKLTDDARCLREFKFSLLDDGSHYDADLVGEQVLLQGVVDCALLEDDGITIVDFKTDRVNREDLVETVERYTPQIHTYADALQRIYEKPIKGSFLYFFRLGCFVPV